MLHPVVIPVSAAVSCSPVRPYFTLSSSAIASRREGSPRIGPYFAAS